MPGTTLPEKGYQLRGFSYVIAATGCEECRLAKWPWWRHSCPTHNNSVVLLVQTRTPTFVGPGAHARVTRASYGAAATVAGWP